MPWLVVLGRTTWTRNGTSYGPGVHKVDDLTAGAAKRSPVRNLVITDEEPRITRRLNTDEPLSASDVKLGMTDAVELVYQEDSVTVKDLAPEDWYDFSCRHCDAKFPF